MITINKKDFPPQGFLDDHCEDAAFHRAFKNAHVEGFDIDYLQVERNGEELAVIPCFLTELCLGDFIGKFFSFIRMKVAIVGHPSADIGRIEGEISEETLEAANAFLFSQAKLVIYKFFPEHLPLRGFHSIEGMPDPVMEINQDYFSEFHGSKRKHLHREMNLGKRLEYIEIDSSLKPEAVPLDEIFSLYLNTYEHGELQFEKLNREYFRETLPLSHYLLVRHEGKLIGFAQWLEKNGNACGKYLGMDYEKGRQHGIYFAILFQMIRIGIRKGWQELDFGVSGTDIKKRLGCRLDPTLVYFRHSNPLVDFILGIFRSLVRFE